MSVHVLWLFGEAGKVRLKAGQSVDPVTDEMYTIAFLWYSPWLNFHHLRSTSLGVQR